MATLAVMKARIADELNRSDLTSQIALAITSAIDNYKYTRFWFNEGTATSSTAADTEYVSQPATLLSVDSIAITISANDIYTLDPKSYAMLELLQGASFSSGQPYYYAPYKEQYRLYPVPDAIYTLTWSGIIDDTAFSSDSDSNAWSTEAEELIRQRAKAIVRIDVIQHPMAQTEAIMLRQRNSDCLSLLEEAALRNLKRNTAKRVATGYIEAKI